MTARAQLQWAYELAYHPARLNAAWNSWEKGNLADAESLNETVSWALMLHQRLPEAPAVSGRAITSISHLSGKLKAIQTTNNAAPI